MSKYDKIGMGVDTLTCCHCHKEPDVNDRRGWMIIHADC